MAASLNGSTTFLFGPQALSFDDKVFSRLRSAIIKWEDYGWILDAISELPNFAHGISTEYPSLSGRERLSRSLLEELQTWFLTGKPSRALRSLPSTVLSPLVVITQLCQFVEYQKNARFANSSNDHLYRPDLEGTETLGFCMGILSAIVVSCSTGKESFEKLGTIAIRIGTLIGMIVDAQDELEGPSKSLTVVWRSAIEKQKTQKILGNFPEVIDLQALLKFRDLLTDLQAYISVFYDENRATVTASATSVPSIQQQLRAVGITASEIGLNGRFHQQCHHEDIEALMKLCESHEELRFPDASALIRPTRSSEGGQLISTGHLSSVAVRSILLEPAKWYETFRTMLETKDFDHSSRIVSFGLERCVPPSLMRGLGKQVVYPDSHEGQDSQVSFSGDDIAVVGMACKVAGADDVEEFWKLLCEGKSQHTEVPEERFTFETVYRDHDPVKKWYGNFINDHDKFDHKFFKKTPREAVSMDPQQRQILQITYQAIQQSGYFRKQNPETNVGCYLGVCSTDYEDNIGCYAPTAYSATGHLRGFVAGKVSHFFGWTGPGLTIDTACSSSAVAVHQACRAILAGECNAAIAGGSHVNSSPLWYQNLAGASFLSKTGSCKPFDADADGYCRGEGVAAVFLKKLSTAIADGDQVIGVIASSAVQQNENCTPIVVPNVPSLSSLFETVLDNARLKSEQITVVEAHGTGTPVGDPAEFESIRKVLGGTERSHPLAVGSVKGLVGHCECASGIVSLVKALLMIRKGAIPPQASFKKLNSAINLSSEDRMHIPTRLNPWSADFKAVLINNYGASGSNASMIITQGPVVRTSTKPLPSDESLKTPLWLSALDDQSLRAYSTVLRDFYAERSISFTDLAFNLSRQSNRSLGRRLLLNCDSRDDLDRQLSAFCAGDSMIASTDQPESQPVILCFGGQLSKYVGLDHGLYESITVLRGYLNLCDSYCISMGVGSMFPNIFQKTPIEDIIKLQTCLFALQYSCAKSWMDCGVQPAAVIGHSFGELTSLCIAGVLSLEDALKLVVIRARIIRDSWSPERGTMMAIEAAPNVLQQLLSDANATCREHEPAVVACHNGPTSFTVAGSKEALDIVETTIRENVTFSSVNSKRLNVTHAFHSTFVDPLMEDLREATKDLRLRAPKIYIARCTENLSEQKVLPDYFANHLRMPVFFSQSVQRLASQFPQCIWLEAGSNSTIVNMVGKILSMPSGSHFQSVNVTNDKAWNNLAEATTKLWRAGLDVSFWAHHHAQAPSHTSILLPPYQFEQSRHWLDLKKPQKQVELSGEEPLAHKLPETLTTFMGYLDKDKRNARFRINTMIPEYEKLMKGHTVAYTAPICPVTVQVDLVIESVKTIFPSATQLQPQLNNIQNETPICTDKSLSTWIDLEVSKKDSNGWKFRISSTNPQRPTVNVTHTKGELLFRPSDDLQTNLDFARYARLTGHARCKELLDGPDESNVIQGRSIYKTFSEVVDYGEQYQGLQKVVGRGQSSAGNVTKQYNPKTWFDAYLSDNFCQVVGIWVNYMTERVPTNLYICKGIEKWVRLPRLEHDARPDSYDVLAYHQGSLDDGYVTDVFVFNPKTGELLEVVLGIQFTKVPKASLSKLLTRLTNDGNPPATPNPGAKEVDVTKAIEAIKLEQPVARATNRTITPEQQKKNKQHDIRASVFSRLKLIIVELSGVDSDRIKEETELADIGIDSLMGMELISEIDRTFKCALPEDGEIADVTDVAGVLKCVLDVLSPSSRNSELDDSEEDTTDSVFDDNQLSNSAGTDTVSSESEPEINVDLPSESADMYLPNGTTGSNIESKKALGHSDQTIPISSIIEAFMKTKALTDQFLTEQHGGDYVGSVLPMHNKLCIALTLEAFEKMGCSIKSVSAGQRVAMFKPLPQYVHLVRNLCEMLEKVGKLIIINGETIIRTAVPYPKLSGQDMMLDPSETSPKHHDINKLIFYVGSHLADALSGKIDGVKLIFGNPEGRDLVSRLYGDWIMNRPSYQQMKDFLARLVSRMPTDVPLRILEMGGGTGGTTKWLVPHLAKLNHPVEYTFTDLAPSFAAAARKAFKQYPFMTFQAHDIEKEPAPDLMNKYHVVVSSNAVHATHSLVTSAKNIRKALMPNGILMMLEMIEPLYWIDMIFGLFEGWWLFDDGRKHALTPVARWKADLQEAGFGHVDWTEGQSPEANINKVIIGIACEQGVDNRCELSSAVLERQRVIEEYVHNKTLTFLPPDSYADTSKVPEICVLVTGATGSTGSHLVADLARRASVSKIICLNRRSSQDPRQRQLEAFGSKEIFLSSEEIAKLQVLETNSSKAKLGLPDDIYQDLVDNVTHIIHNAWAMSIKRPVQGFESQFDTMRNLIDLARDTARKQPTGSKVHFEFVSSIAVVGHYPLQTNDANVPEERMPVAAILPIGYADAKYVCELMLDRTLHLHPDRFGASVVRLGQIAGSTRSGFWNAQEHLSFLWKSSQTLRKLPALQGPCSWTPVDSVAGTLADLLFVRNPCPVYNVDNPVRQQWENTVAVIARALDLPREKAVVPFDQWVALVRAGPTAGLTEKENPATRLVEFLDKDFLRMSCGGILLDTTKAREHSATLRAVGPITQFEILRYFEYWRRTGFLS